MACARNEGEKRLVRKVSGLLDLCYGCSSCNIQFRRLFFCGFAPYKTSVKLKEKQLMITARYKSIRWVC